MKLVELKKEEYSSFEKSLSYASFWQNPVMAEMKEDQGCSVLYAGLKEGNDILCAACFVGYPTVNHWRIYYAFRGFLIDYSNQELLKMFLNEIKAFLSQRKGIYLHFNPYSIYRIYDKDAQEIADEPVRNELYEFLVSLGCKHKGFTRGYDTSTEPRWMMALDLKGKSEADLLASMDQQTRWSINRANKYPIHLHECTYDELHIFQEMLDRTSKRRGFSSYPLSYYQALYKGLGNDRVKVIIAQLNTLELQNSLENEKKQYETELQTVEAKLSEMPNSKKFIKKKKVCLEGIELSEKKVQEAKELEMKYGQILNLAGSLFIIDPSEIIYLLSASEDQFKKFNAPYAIQWHMIKEAMSKNFGRYNFYGTSGIFDESASDYGVYEFKKGFNANVIELVGDFEYILNNQRYFIYNTLKRIQGLVRK